MPSLRKASKLKKKEKSLSWWVKKCDIAISLLIRSRGVCDASDVSSCGGGLQHAHIVSRTNKTLRYDIINGLSLCYKHHIFWAHKEPLDFVEWFQRKYPERYEYLMASRNIICANRTVEDYKKILQDIKDKNYKALVFGAKLTT